MLANPGFARWRVTRCARTHRSLGPTVRIRLPPAASLRTIGSSAAKEPYNGLLDHLPTKRVAARLRGNHAGSSASRVPQASRSCRPDAGRHQDDPERGARQVAACRQTPVGSWLNGHRPRQDRRSTGLIANTPIRMPSDSSRSRTLASRRCRTATGIGRVFPWPPLWRCRFGRR